MNVKDWELLVALHEEGTITKTAQKLYISQPALTYRIKQIEKEFQTKIIFRGSRGVIFSNEGEYLVKFARNMLDEFHKAKDSIINMNEEIKGTLRIGVSSNFALYQLPDLMEGFLNKFPKVEINLHTGWSSEIMNLIHREEVHLAIVRGEHIWPYEQLVFKNETLCVASKNNLKLEDLPNQNQINYKTEADLNHTFTQWWQNQFKVPPKRTMEVDRLETAKELVKKGLGYGLFPSICLIDEKKLYTIDLSKEKKKIYRQTSLLYREELLNLKVVGVFISYISDFYNLK